MSHLLYSVVKEEDDLEEERDKKCPKQKTAPQSLKK